MHVLMCTIFILPVRDNIYKPEAYPSFTRPFTRMLVPFGTQFLLPAVLFSIFLYFTSRWNFRGDRRSWQYFTSPCPECIGILPMTIIDEDSDRFASWKINGRRKMIRFQNGLSVRRSTTLQLPGSSHWLSSRVARRPARHESTRDVVWNRRDWNYIRGHRWVQLSPIDRKLPSMIGPRSRRYRNRTDEACTDSDRRACQSARRAIWRSTSEAEEYVAARVSASRRRDFIDEGTLHPFHPRASQSDRQLCFIANVNVAWNEVPLPDAGIDVPSAAFSRAADPAGSSKSGKTGRPIGGVPLGESIYYSGSARMHLSRDSNGREKSRMRTFRLSNDTISFSLCRWP